MKEYKIIRMNEAHARMLTNGNWHCAEDYPWTEKMLNFHLEQGYTVKQMITTISPGERGGGGYSFYKDGFIFLLEHDTEQGEVTPEDWEENNQLTEETRAFLEKYREEENDEEQAEDFDGFLQDALEEALEELEAEAGEEGLF